MGYGYQVVEQIYEVDQVETNIKSFDLPQTVCLIDQDGRGTKIRIYGQLRGSIVCPHAEIYIPHRAVAASIQKWMTIYDARTT